VDPVGDSTGRQVVIECLGVLAVGLLPSAIGMTGPVYFLGAIGLGLFLSACGVGLAVSRSPAGARRLVYASLIYLPSLFLLMALDKLPT
jgi:protoheme IX farnesyltransferase